jgi:predicted aspartyl protease
VLRDGERVLSELTFPSDRAEVVFPLAESGVLLLTDAVTVNGRGLGWFVIDTGANFTTLDRTAAEQLGITVTDLWKRREGLQEPDGLYRIRSLQIGGMTLSNHVIGVLDLSSITAASPNDRPIGGVLGGDVWGALPFTVDYPGKRLVIHGRRAFRPPSGAMRYDLQLDRPFTRGLYMDANPAAGVPVVEAKIDGVRTRIMLDTGSTGTLLLLPSFTAAHPASLPSDARVVARAAGAGGLAGLAGMDLLRAEVDHVDALGARFACAGTALAIRGESNSGKHTAVLGAGFLQNGCLTFDYAARRLWVEWRGGTVAGREDAPALLGRDAE